MKIINVISKVLLSLILLMPILGAVQIFPAPTRELYNTDIAFEFIEMLMTTRYINYIMSAVFALSIVLLWMKREALAAILITPITVNIIAFHLFLDGGLFTPGAVMGNILLVLNIFFLYQNRAKFKPLQSP
ncbi:hypothetical protein KBD81_05785 [Candidatus Woesebacteria bacterium]|nr:hypothetical protein [Candidatus Woesebacteria bacterium]